MHRPLSLIPSLSYAIDDVRRPSTSGSASGERVPPQVRFATDVLGVTIFFVMLGIYLTAHF